MLPQSAEIVKRTGEFFRSRVRCVARLTNRGVQTNFCNRDMPQGNAVSPESGKERRHIQCLDTAGRGLLNASCPFESGRARQRRYSRPTRLCLIRHGKRAAKAQKLFEFISSFFHFPLAIFKMLWYNSRVYGIICGFFAAISTFLEVLLCQALSNGYWVLPFF